MVKSKKELREELKKWLKSQRLHNRKFYSLPINRMVEFTNKGMRHAISVNHKKHTEIEIRMIKDIMKILPNSFYMGFDKNENKSKKEEKGVHNFYDIVLFDGALYEVWFKVKETKDKAFFYDHGIISKL